MSTRLKYAKRSGVFVVAIRLDLDTSGFTYRKWGGEQTFKPGDRIVNNGGDIYTVNRDTFARSWHDVSAGLYRKIAPVWAEVADCDGAIKTKEGVTQYRAGDYLVFNDEQGQGGCLMPPSICGSDSRSPIFGKAPAGWNGSSGRTRRWPAQGGAWASATHPGPARQAGARLNGVF